jgi:hypothetical protein
MTGMTIHQISSPQAAVLLALQKLTRGQIDAALAVHREAHGARIGTVIGIANAGIIYSHEVNWSPDMPDALDDLCIVPWVFVHELLGNVPPGTMDDFIKSGGHQ